MPSSPAVPRVRLGPRFAAVNDIDRDVEEALGLEPEPPSLPQSQSQSQAEAGLEVEEPEAAASTVEEMLVEPEVKGVDEEIDELLSETEEPVGKDSSGWKCRWDDCWKDQDSQDLLVEHLQIEHIGQGREIYVCQWEHCPRKGQKQATRHSLITHCRAHTGERPYTCQEPDCGKTFTRSDALTKHLRSLHNITPEVPLRKKGKDASGQVLSMTNLPLGSPATSPLLMTKPAPKETGDVDEAIADILPLSPTTTNLDPTLPPVPVSVPVPAAKASKAKPRRSRAKTDKGKMAAAQASAQASGSNTSTQAPNTRIRNYALPLPSTSAFYNPGMGELNNDEDLSSVLPRLFGRHTFWEGSDDDEPALDLIRGIRTRDRRPPPSGVAEEEYDSLDEMIPPIGPVRVIGETEHPDGSEVVVPVMSRSRHQARFMMAKAKVMLLAEENDMRRKELEATLSEEIELDKHLAKRNRNSTK